MSLKNTLHACGVTYEIVSNIPKVPEADSVIIIIIIIIVIVIIIFLNVAWDQWRCCKVSTLTCFLYSPCFAWVLSMFLLTYLHIMLEKKKKTFNIK